MLHGVIVATGRLVRADSSIASVTRKVCSASRALTSGVASPRTTAQKCSSWRDSGSVRCTATTLVSNGFHHERSPAWAPTHASPGTAQGATDARNHITIFVRITCVTRILARGLLPAPRRRRGVGKKKCPERAIGEAQVERHRIFDGKAADRVGHERLHLDDFAAHRTQVVDLVDHVDQYRAPGSAPACRRK